MALQGRGERREGATTWGGGRGKNGGVVLIGVEERDWLGEGEGVPGWGGLALILGD